MWLRVLGTLELAEGTGDVGGSGSTVPLRSPLLRRLLAVLAVRTGQVVSVDRIADAVWGDEPPAHIDGALQNLISRLRAALGANGGGVTVLTRAPGYMLCAPREAVDATRFEDLAAQAAGAAEAGEVRDAAALFDAALALWRGPAYAEFADEDFARAEAVRLEELRTAAVEDRIDAALVLGHHDQVVPRLEALVAEQPLRERPHAELMLALYRCGRHSDALRVYRDYRQRLNEDLGLEPSPALQRLEAAVLRQDRGLDWKPTARVEPAQPIPFRPPQTAPAEPAATGNLSPVLPHLVGRGELVTAVTKHLDTARALTLTGPGGVGKTSVALHAAADQRDSGRFRDGVWWCELAAIRDPGAVPAALATALEIQQRQGLTALERLVEYLRPRQLLLVLDNCEHLLAVVAGLVETIMRGCPQVTVLATSRESLGVSNEHVRPIPPLAVPPAGTANAAAAVQAASVVLFAQRASAAAPHFAVTDANAAGVAEVCRRLDGVPLAIELAAARMRSMSATEVCERLGGRFGLLRSAKRISLERHRTLRAVIDWSYELLEPGERQVFDQLSVFAGEFTLDAAEHVAAGGPVDEAEVADLLTRLVDKSMVVAAPSDEHTRYRLLETLRDYGRQRLEGSGAEGATRRTHLGYTVERAEAANAQLGSAHHARWARTIDGMLDDLRVAHSWALEHGQVDTALRLVAALSRYAEHRIASEVATWAENTVEAAETTATFSALLPTGYAVAAGGARFSGDLERAKVLAKRGVAASAGADDPARCLPLYLLQEVALFQGRLDEADRLAREVHRLASVTGQPFLAVWAGVNRVLVRAYRGDVTGASALAEEVSALAASTKDPTAIAWARYGAGEALLEAHPEQAVTLLEDALRRARALGERYLTGVALVSIASVRSRRGDPRQALEIFRDAVRHWHRAGNWTQQWTTVRNVVDLLVRLGADEPAALLYGAVSTRRTAAPVFGADADRLEQAHRLLTERLGAQQFTAAAANGMALGDDDVVGLVCDVIDDPALLAEAGF